MCVQDQVLVQDLAVDETDAEAAPVMEDEPKYILLQTVRGDV